VPIFFVYAPTASFHKGKILDSWRTNKIKFTILQNKAKLSVILQDEEKNTIQQLICTYKYIVEVRILILGNFWHIFSNINVMKIVETYSIICCIAVLIKRCVSCRWSLLCIWINSSQQEDPVGEPSAQVNGSLIFFKLRDVAFSMYNIIHLIAQY
jgi:hypothetical protein